MTNTSARTLVVCCIDCPVDDIVWPDDIEIDGDIAVLCFRDQDNLPESWRMLDARDYLDTDALRRDFLELLDNWPRKPLAGGRSFDRAFRTDGDYSIWWTGPGLERHPDHGVFPVMRKLWICVKVIDDLSPNKVVICTKDQRLATMLASKCQSSGCEAVFPHSCAKPIINQWSKPIRWFLASAIWLLISPVLMMVRAIRARILAGSPKTPLAELARTAIVAVASFPRHVRFEEQTGYVWYWREIEKALSEKAPDVRLRYLLNSAGRSAGQSKWTAWSGRRDWSVLRNVPNLAPLTETHACFWDALRLIPRQVSLLVKYFALERRESFRKSFVFAGADVSSIYAPLLRRAVSRMAVWSRAVSATAASIRSAGNVKCVLVNEEMYASGQVTIAAARKLGIPTIGTQHGTIFPMHLVYTPPPGQIQGAPIPDYFAAYGEFAKDVVSRFGAFPPQRVWITGSPRFDHLVNSPRDADAARKELDLPADKRIVLVATQFYPWFQDAGKAVFKGAKGRDDLLVCVKTHPKDVPLDVYRRLSEDVGADNILFFTDRFDDLLAACDVLVSGSSTTLFEAILLGKRAICVNFSDEPDRYPYVEDGGALAARSTEEMEAALDQVLSSENDSEWETRRRKFLKRHAGPSAHGKAAQTLAQHLSNILNETKTP